MNWRQLGIVFGVLAALVAVWMALRSGGVANGGTALDIDSRLGADVSYISVERRGEPRILLQARETGWIVDGYPAEDTVVAAMLEQLDTLSAARLVARNPSSHERLGVTDSLSALVEFGTAEGPQLAFRLGGSGPEGRFIRLPDRPEVYVVPDTAVKALDRGTISWRALTIATVDTAALGRFVIQRGAGDVVDVRRGAGGQWTIGGAAVDTTRIRVFLETVARLDANGFPADSFVFAVDFERPQATLDLYAGTGPADPPTVSLWFASIPERSEVLVRRADDATAFALEPIVANLLTAGRTRWLQP
jgi:hypothetical protein